MTTNLNNTSFVIGIGTSERSLLWRQQLSGIPGIEFVSAERRGFFRVANLDIEIMATYLVVGILGLAPPKNVAGVYRDLGEKPYFQMSYAPTVIVPPALDLRNWPEELGGASNGPRPGNDAYRAWEDEHPSEIDLFSWRAVFRSLQEVISGSALATRPRVGLHCENILPKVSDSVELRFLTAFETVYLEALAPSSTTVSPAS